MNRTSRLVTHSLSHLSSLGELSSTSFLCNRRKRHNIKKARREREREITLLNNGPLNPAGGWCAIRYLVVIFSIGCQGSFLLSVRDESWLCANLSGQTYSPDVKSRSYRLEQSRDKSPSPSPSSPPLQQCHTLARKRQRESAWTKKEKKNEK